MDDFLKSKKRILLMDSGSYNTFGGSVKGIALMYGYLSRLGTYDIDLLGDFSKMGLHNSIGANEVFAGGRHSAGDYYRMIARRFFFKGRLIETYSPGFFKRDYDLVVLNSRMDVPIIDEYKKAHPNTKTIYIDRANIITNNAYALRKSLLLGFAYVLRESIPKALGRSREASSTSFLGSLGTVYICHLMRRWLDTYISILPELGHAARFFKRRTRVAHVGLAIGAEYVRLKGFTKSYLGGVYIGRLDERQKRVAFMIRGIREAIDAHPELSGSELLRVVGDGPDSGHYRKLAHALGLDKNIRFFGHMAGDGLVKMYNDSGFYVSASEWESPGRAFVEAMACGIPVLLNDRNNAVVSGNMKERMVKDGKNGMVYRYDDAGDFANKFYAMYSNTGALERMGRRAEEFAKRNFSLDKQNRMYAEEIKRALGARTAQRK
ncbi:MAG: glycosyltransferase family 4 protein [Candidatus Marsarchaeota archaeon]|jgi:glycosyltransferase involved in cell wall biosynthesis|nr:glycosyltransferase family 4 protein [Candidatus Marsarchaeota archaeon]